VVPSFMMIVKMALFLLFSQTSTLTTWSLLRPSTSIIRRVDGFLKHSLMVMNSSSSCQLIQLYEFPTCSSNLACFGKSFIFFWYGLQSLKSAYVCILRRVAYRYEIGCNQNRIMNLTVPRSYFSEQNSWRYEYFTYVYI